MSAEISIREGFDPTSGFRDSLLVINSTKNMLWVQNISLLSLEEQLKEIALHFQMISFTMCTERWTLLLIHCLKQDSHFLWDKSFWLRLMMILLLNLVRLYRYYRLYDLGYGWITVICLCGQQHFSDEIFWSHQLLGQAFTCSSKDLWSITMRESLFFCTMPRAHEETVFNFLLE